MRNKAAYSIEYLMRKHGLTREQAAGVIGNLMQESSLNPQARNPGDGRDGSDSIGLAQWNGERARNMRSFVGDDYNNIDRQLDFVMHEMKGDPSIPGGSSEASAWKALQNSSDIDSSARAMIGYERPQGWSAKNPTGGHGWDNRLKYAHEAAGTPYDPSAQNTAQASAQTATETASTRPKNGVVLDAINNIFGTDFKVPEKIAGVDSNKVTGAFSGMGEWASAMQKQSDAMNAQAKAATPSRGSNAPIEVAFAPTQAVPSAEEELKKRRKRRGGIAGLGGYNL